MWSCGRTDRRRLSRQPTRRRASEDVVNAGLVDSHGRGMRDLRVSLTERCNFRCLYCLPETEEAANFYRAKVAGPTDKPFVFKLPDRARSEILTFEEIERLVRISVA